MSEGQDSRVVRLTGYKMFDTVQAVQDFSGLKLKKQLCWFLFF